MRRTLPAILLGLCLGLPTPAAGGAQESAAAAKPPGDEVFSGTVVACTPTKLTVTRKSLDRTTVTRTFSLDGNTKVEGAALKPKLRVTVRFVATEDGLKALHIIVR